MTDNSDLDDGSLPPGTPMSDALDWFARRQGGNLAAAEQHAFAAWLAADPAHAEAYRRIERLWAMPGFRGALGNHNDRDPALHRRPLARRGNWTSRIAAVAAAAAVAFMVAAIGPEVATTLRADHHTATGERRTTRLADGSEMVLNTASAAAVTFAADARRVRLLRGEAYFDVVSDAARPFEVVAGDARVRVIGTTFTVRRLEDAVRVAVRRGTVAVSGAGKTGDSATLGAGEAVVVADGRIGRVEPADVDVRLAWLGGRFVFHDRPLSDVLAELQRYHAGWLAAASGRARTTRVSGNYRLQDPAEVARALADATALEATALGDLVLILH